MDSHEKDKALEGLLRHSLESQSAHAYDRENGQCPSADTLAAYYERSLSPDECAACETHFSQCVHCRASLAAMVRGEEISPAAASKWAWLLNPYWLAPAIAGFALVIFFAVRNPKQAATNSPLAEAPLVAQSQQNEVPRPPAPQSAPELSEAAPAAHVRQKQDTRPDARERDALATPTPANPPPSVHQLQPGSVNQTVEVTAAQKAADKETTPAPVANSLSTTS